MIRQCNIIRDIKICMTLYNNLTLKLQVQIKHNNITFSSSSKIRSDIVV